VQPFLPVDAELETGLVPEKQHRLIAVCDKNQKQ